MCSSDLGLVAATLLGGGVGLMVVGYGLTGVAAVAAGAVLLGTAILTVVGCLIAEIANRGGLHGGWSLPIVADTLAEPGPAGSQMPAAVPVPITFAPES